MSNTIASRARLRRAVASVVEKLEDRRLMAADPSAVQQLPYAIDFDTDRGGVLDKDGEGTGFTRLQGNTAGNEYQQGLIDLDRAAGILRVTAKGTSSNGTNFNGDNTLKNLLETQFDATAAGGFTITARLKGPLTNFNYVNNQAGISFGPDQDNYVKLIAHNDAGKNYVQFMDEQTTGGTYAHTITTASSLTNIGSFANVNTLDLVMTGDPATGKVLAFYRVNGGALTKVTAELTLTGAKRDAFFGTAARAGVLAAKKSNSPDFTATFDRFEIVAGTPQNNRPTVIATRPANGATGVSVDGFVAVDVSLPTPGKGIDPNTVSSDSVRLYRTSDRSLVANVTNIDGAGGSLVLQPSADLDANTSYTFEITDGLKDAAGASFLPFTTTFTTGNLIAQPDSLIAFEKVMLPTAAGQKFTGVTVGPDGLLYASTETGDIYRWVTNADGTLGVAQVITTVRTANAANRLISGVAFDPASTANNLILWVSHSFAAVENATDFTGKVSRLSGANLEQYQDYVVNLPRSIMDHTTNQPSFGPDGHLYFQQGSMTAMGAPDNTWGLRSEHLLSAAILRVNTAAIAARIAGGQGALDVRTTDVGGTYNPLAPGAAVTLYATGVRNAYDLVWHTNGHLYAPTNGSAAGGALPATSTTAAVAKNNQTQDDWLYDVVQGNYYGHPNPVRNETVAHGANPTQFADANEVSAYPVGTQPATTYVAPAYTFGKNYSPNGSIEYRSNAFNGALKGKLLVTRYSGGDDVLVLDVKADGSIGPAQTGIAGLTHFVDPLDVTENVANGFLYVSEYGGSRITLLRPIAPGANLAVNKTNFYFNDVRGDAKAGPAQVVKITNTGTQPLALSGDGLTIGGADASQFAFVNKPSLPRTIQPGQSLDVQVAMNANAVGLKAATLTIKSNDPDQPTTVVTLRGLGTTGTGGQNEPSLQRILDLYGIPVNVGDSNPNTTDLYNTSEPLSATSEEVLGMERLVKAGPGGITITPLAVMGVGSSPVLRFGHYSAGTNAAKTELFTVNTADAQTVSPTIVGETSFDPGAKAFGVYATWPAFKAADGINFRDTFSEDALNRPWDPASPHKVRFYPMKNADGSVVPNAYLMAFEEFNAGFDSNDIVAIITNVAPAAAGPEIGWENLDTLGNAGFHDRLVFNRIGILNTTTPDVVKDTATLRLRNTGSQDLIVGGVTATPGWTVMNAPTAPIAPGGTYDLVVKFTQTSGAFRTGTLNIQSNDADEPTTAIQLAGFYQAQSENNQEPIFQTIVDLFGYKTQILKPGETFGNGEATAVGDEVLSGYWTRADGQQPVQVRQLAAYHGQGNTATFSWHAKGSFSTSALITHDRAQGQSLLPHKAGTNFATPAYATLNTSSTFGIRIDGEWSDDTRNPQEQPGGGFGHHVRFFPAKDRDGKLIPNTYIVGMDYSGINYDFQDNLYLVSNIKPEAPAAVTSLVATGGTAGVALDWADNSPRNLAGYNVYRSATSGGTYAKVASAVTASEFVDASAPSGVTSFYRVTAVDTFGTESVAATASALRSSDTTPPATPADLVATGGGTGISLAWSANADADLAGYNVYRGNTADGTFMKLNAGLLTTPSYVDTNAPAGVTSFYRVTAVDAAGLQSTPATASAARTLDGNAPVAPAGLVANGSVSGVSLDWSDNVEADLAGYNVYRAASANGAYQKLNASPFGTSSYADVNAPTGVTSFYRVTAVDTAGNESAPSSASGTRMDGLAPAAPTGLAAVADAGGVALSWAANDESDLAGYDLFRGTSASGPFAKVNGAVLTSPNFVDAQAPVGTASHYYVVAVDNAGNASAPGATVSATRPAAAGSIRINAAGGGFTDAAGQVWQADAGFTGTSSVSTNAMPIGGTTDDALYFQRRWGQNFGYSIATPDGQYTLRLHFAEVFHSAAGKRVFSVSAEGTTVVANLDLFAESGFRNAVVKTVTVNVTNGALDLQFVSSVDNAIISAIELIPQAVAPAQPAAATGLTATATSASQVDLAWADNATNETGYRVERSANGSTFTTVATLGADATAYADTGLPASTTYTYRVVALNGSTASGPSNLATATTQAAAPVAPAMPTNLVATAASASAVNLAWADNASNETGYLVERSTGGSAFSTVATLAANATGYADTGLAPSTGYSYRVTALGSGGANSAASNVATATTNPAPAAGVNLALGRPATSSSFDNNLRKASAAVDGSAGTRWASASRDAEWITVDLGQTYAIGRVKLTWEAAYGKGYKIQVSADNVNWTDAFVETNGNGGTDDIAGLTAEGRYVRMQGVTRGTVYGYSLFEFEVYGQ